MHTFGALKLLSIVAIVPYRDQVFCQIPSTVISHMVSVVWDRDAKTPSFRVGGESGGAEIIEPAMRFCEYILFCELPTLTLIERNTLDIEKQIAIRWNIRDLLSCISHGRRNLEFTLGAKLDSFQPDIPS
jgi:hypothetical protein